MTFSLTTDWNKREISIPGDEQLYNVCPGWLCH